MALRRGFGAAVALLVLCAPLAGCRGQGTVDVRSDDQIVVDLEMWADDPSDAKYVGINLCNWIRPMINSGLKATPLSDGASVGCRVRGTTGLHGPIGFLPYTAQRLGDEYLFGVGGQPFEGLVADASGNDGIVIVTFPGPVLAASSGVVQGNSVTFTDLNVLAREGFAISALSHPGPSAQSQEVSRAAVGGLVAGFLLGGAVVAASVAATRRLRRRSGPNDDPAGWAPPE